jgi:hypothetical protein
LKTRRPLNPRPIKNWLDETSHARLIAHGPAFTQHTSKAVGSKQRPQHNHARKGPHSLHAVCLAEADRDGNSGESSKTSLSEICCCLSRRLPVCNRPGKIRHIPVIWPSTNLDVLGSTMKKVENGLANHGMYVFN